MFIKGDKIVYPMYGAGIIEELKEKKVDNVVHLYYLVNMPVGNLTITVSVDKADQLGIRRVNSGDTVIENLKSVSKMPIEVNSNWAKRQKDNMDTIRTGNLLAIAVLYRNLLVHEKEKGLSGAEKKMLVNSKQIIMSEIIMSQDIDKEQCEKMLYDLVECVL